MVTIPITQNKIIPSFITYDTATPAAPAVILGAPWITKSVDKARPWPNKFNATATPIAGSPALIATGKNTAPTKATAGVGQKNQERTNITNPVTKNAVLEFFITLENGLTIYCIALLASRALDNATIIAIIKIIGPNSFKDIIKELNTAVIAPKMFFSKNNPIKKTPNIHGTIVSFFIIIVINIITISRM